MLTLLLGASLLSILGLSQKPVWWRTERSGGKASAEGLYMPEKARHSVPLLRRLLGIELFTGTDD
jgi:hypothetical protein